MFLLLVQRLRDRKGECAAAEADAWQQGRMQSSWAALRTQGQMHTRGGGCTTAGAVAPFCIL